VLRTPSGRLICKATVSIAVAAGLNIRVLLAKRLRRAIKILALSALSFCLPAMAHDQDGWQFDSLRADSVSKNDAQQIYEVLLKMLDRWNAHDIEGYLEVYWKSPELLVVIDSEQFNGWQQLYDSYINGYPDRHSMGFIDPKRIKVKLLKADLALALTWWSISFPTSKQTVVGNTTMNLQKFDDGWRVVAAHSGTSEM
jgi:beta-aspartyl-peptidase (threonine type)